MDRSLVGDPLAGVLQLARAYDRAAGEAFVAGDDERAGRFRGAAAELRDVHARLQNLPALPVPAVVTRGA